MSQDDALIQVVEDLFIRATEAEVIRAARRKLGRGADEVRSDIDRLIDEGRLRKHFAISCGIAFEPTLIPVPTGPSEHDEALLAAMEERNSRDSGFEHAYPPVDLSHHTDPEALARSMHQYIRHCSSVMGQQPDIETFMRPVRLSDGGTGFEVSWESGPFQWIHADRPLGMKLPEGYYIEPTWSFAGIITKGFGLSEGEQQ